MEQKTVKKLSAAAIGVPAAAIVAWGVKAFGGVDVPVEIAAAFGAVCTFVASVLIPDEREE